MSDGPYIIIDFDENNYIKIKSNLTEEGAKKLLEAAIETIEALLPDKIDRN